MINYIDGREPRRHPIDLGLPSLFEDWSAGFIGTVWSTLIAGTGAFAVAIDAGRGSRIAQMTTGAGAGSRISLRSQTNWQCRSDGVYDNTSSLFGTQLEFEVEPLLSADLDPATFFMGFSPNPAGSRASNGIIGIYSDNTDWYSVTDDAGAETTNQLTNAGAIQNQWWHFGIRQFDDQIQFYVDHGLAATHLTNLPTISGTLIFNVQNAGAANFAINLTNISIGYERYPEQTLV